MCASTWVFNPGFLYTQLLMGTSRGCSLFLHSYSLVRQ